MLKPTVFTDATFATFAIPYLKFYYSQIIKINKNEKKYFDFIND